MRRPVPVLAEAPPEPAKCLPSRGIDHDHANIYSEEATELPRRRRPAHRLEPRPRIRTGRGIASANCIR
jgi:hypothetical protein